MLHLAIWQLQKAVDVGNFGLAESAQSALQLQTRECLGHLPKLDVAEACRKNINQRNTVLILLTE